MTPAAGRNSLAIGADMILKCGKYPGCRGQTKPPLAFGNKTKPHLKLYNPLDRAAFTIAQLNPK